MIVTVYVEGGGQQNKDLPTQCRRAFRTFFESAGVPSGTFRVVACGGRSRAYAKFLTAHQNLQPDNLPILLVDSEEPVTAADPWEHVRSTQRDRWQRPPGATTPQLYLMVQCMEAWFHADPRAVGRYFGRGFQPNALSRHTNLEAVSPAILESALKTASRDCLKGAYDKGKHSFQILSVIDPGTVTAASPHSLRLINFLGSI